jgi:hypothetical protein
MNLHAIGLFITNQSGNGGGGGNLTAIVLDSDANPFTVTNQVFNSGTNTFLVDADVKNSAGTDFTIFS